MVHFIGRSLLFLVTFIVFGHCIKSLFPYYWGNPWWQSKVPELRSTIPYPNVYFFGSSRTYRHVAPSVFDSIMEANGLRTRSFNLGSPSTFPPQTHFLLEKAIRNGDVPEGSLVFMEFDSPKPMEDQHVGTARGNYWLSVRRYVELYRYDVACNTEHSDSGFLTNYTISALQDLAHWGQFKGLFALYDPQPTSGSRINQAGFFSLEEEMRLNPALEDNWAFRTSELTDDTLMLHRFGDEARSIRGSVPGPICEWYKESTSALSTFCSSRNVELVFVMPPMPDGADEYNAFRNLRKERTIDMGDPDRYPEFHVMKYRFDKGHLNEAGARLYTLELAKQVLAMDLLSGPAQSDK